MVGFVLVSAAVGFLNTLNNIAASYSFSRRRISQRVRHGPAQRLGHAVHSSAFSRNLYRRDLLGVVALSRLGC